jgi:hypothetical protein
MPVLSNKLLRVGGVSAPASIYLYPPVQSLVSIPAVGSSSFINNLGYLQFGQLDPTFGNEVVRITNSNGMNKGYSKMQPWNCDQTVMKLGKSFIHGTNFNLFFTDPGWDGTNTQWSYSDPNKYFMVTQEGQFERVTINAGRTAITREILYDFRANGWSITEGSTSMGGFEGTMNISNRYFTVQGTYNGVANSMGIFQLLGNIVSAVSPIRDLTFYGGIATDFSTVSMDVTPKAFIRTRTSSNPSVYANYLLNLDGTVIKTLESAGSHQDFAYSVAGESIYGHVLPARYEILNTGVKQDIITNANAIAIMGNNIGNHFSARSYNEPGWATISWGPNFEILQVKIQPEANGTCQVRRFCNAYTTNTLLECTPVSSPWGNMIAFLSNGGVQGAPFNTFVTRRNQ